MTECAAKTIDTENHLTSRLLKRFCSPFMLKQLLCWLPVCTCSDGCIESSDSLEFGSTYS